MALMDGGNSALMALMNSFRATAEFSLDPTLPDLVKESAGEML